MIEHEGETVLRNSLIVNYKSSVSFRASQLNLLRLLVVKREIYLVESLRILVRGTKLLFNDLVVDLSIEMAVGDEL
jgi:hypothetical protein